MEHETNNDLCSQTLIKTEWPCEMVISFLNEIKELPVLWDYNHPQYKDNSIKREAWNYLCSKFNSNEEELKRKWMSLQASYRRERSKELKIGRRSSPWFAYSAISFLGDRYKPRREKFTIQIIDDHVKSDETIEYTDDSNIETEDVFAGIFTNVVEDEEEDSQSVEKHEEMEADETVTAKTTVKQYLPSAKKVKRERSSNDYIKQSDGTQKEHNRQRDECVVFGEYVVTKLRKLDSHSRAVAQHYINQTLFEAELGRYRQSFLTEHE